MKNDRTEYFREYRKEKPEKHRMAIHKYWRNKIIKELIEEGKLKDLEENKK